MQITGMLHGARLLEFAGFPATEVLGPDASEEAIKAMIDKYGLIFFIKPVFKGGLGEEARPVCSAAPRACRPRSPRRTALLRSTWSATQGQGQHVTFEAGVPAEHEVYFRSATRLTFGRRR